MDAPAVRMRNHLETRKQGGLPDSPRIAVIGAGWFGCTIASELMNEGLSVRVFEKEKDLFTGASGHNQFRLHLGFHYPRSHVTRMQTRAGFRRFMENYPQFSAPVEQNVYAVCEQASLLDFETYRQIMEKAGLWFQIHSPEEFGLQRVEGCLLCRERRVLTDVAKQWFREALGDSLAFESPVREIQVRDKGVCINGEEFDLAVNCSNQTHSPHQQWSLIYETCVTLLYEGPPDHPALTLMDGPFFTIYPFQNNVFTVYSVVDSRQGKFSTSQEAGACLNNLNSEQVRDVRRRMESSILEYYPSFSEQFRFAGIHRSVRTIFPDSNDARPCCVVDDRRLIQVMSGKIDAVFFALDEVKKCMARYYSPAVPARFARSSQNVSRSA